MGRKPLVGIGLPIIEASRAHSDTPQSLGPSGRVIISSQGPIPDNIQYSQETEIHSQGGIRIHNLDKRAAADPHLRTRGYRDWQFIPMSIDKTTTHKLRVLKASLAQILSVYQTTSTLSRRPSTSPLTRFPSTSPSSGAAQVSPEMYVRPVTCQAGTGWKYKYKYSSTHIQIGG